MFYTSAKWPLILLIQTKSNSLRTSIYNLLIRDFFSICFSFPKPLLIINEVILYSNKCTYSGPVKKERYTSLKIHSYHGKIIYSSQIISGLKIVFLNLRALHRPVTDYHDDVLHVDMFFHTHSNCLLCLKIWMWGIFSFLLNYLFKITYKQK